MIRYGNTARKSLQIRAWMVKNGLTNQELAKRIGFEQGSAVSKTIYGYNNNRKVLAALVAAGCPKRFLALPEDMKGRRIA